METETFIPTNRPMTGRESLEHIRLCAEMFEKKPPVVNEDTYENVMELFTSLISTVAELVMTDRRQHVEAITEGLQFISVLNKALKKFEEQS